MLSDVVIQRLAFIRYLYNIAVQQSQQPEPLAAASILSFHDSIELFLQLASEHLNVVKNDKNKNFMEYFPLLDSKLPSGGLAQKESIHRLNKSRVAMKHHGTLPSKLDIEAFRASATNFFNDNTKLVFEIDFNFISLVNLVQCAKTRELLKKANEHMSNCDWLEAIVKIRSAFEELVDDYEESARKCHHGRSPFIIGEDFRFSRHRPFWENQDRKTVQYMEALDETIHAIQETMKVFILDFDYRKYMSFRLSTPELGEKNSEGERRIFPIHHKPSQSDCQFCFDFVIECAIKLQEFDFEIEK